MEDGYLSKEWAIRLSEERVFLGEGKQSKKRAKAEKAMDISTREQQEMPRHLQGSETLFLTAGVPVQTSKWHLDVQSKVISSGSLF